MINFVIHLIINLHSPFFKTSLFSLEIVSLYSACISVTHSHQVFRLHNCPNQNVFFTADRKIRYLYIFSGDQGIQHYPNNFFSVLERNRIGKMRNCSLDNDLKCPIVLKTVVICCLTFIFSINFGIFLLFHR